MMFSTGVAEFSGMNIQVFCASLVITGLIFLIFTVRRPAMMLTGCILMPLLMMTGGAACAVATLIFGEMMGAIAGVFVIAFVFVLFSGFTGWMKKARP